MSIINAGGLQIRQNASQQPTANGQQPTANGQWPTANSQQPTANGLLKYIVWTEGVSTFIDSIHINCT